MDKKRLRVLFWVITLALAFYILWLVKDGLFPFMFALLIAYILNPVVDYIENKGLKRFWSVIMVYAISFVGIFLIGIIIIPLLVIELDGFGKELPQIFARTEEFVGGINSRYQTSPLPQPIRIAFDGQLLALQNYALGFVASIVSCLIKMLTWTVGFAISPVLAFYLLLDCKEIKCNITKIIPWEWQKKFFALVHDSDNVLHGVIRGQIMVALIVGVFISAGLFFLKVKFALLIGLLAGILDVIPYFGAIIGAAPAVLLAVLESPMLVGKVFLLFFVVHQLEGTIIGPKILSHRVGLHPLTVIAVLFVGGELAGLLGMLLAVPIAAVLKVVLQHINSWL